MTKPIKKTPDSTMMITLDFEQGASVELNGLRMNAVSLRETLNELARCHGISVANIIENRLVDMKIRGVYEAPAATVLYKAHHMLETLCLDKATLHLKQSLQQYYANIVYEQDLRKTPICS
jgi:argininosuccinate synthase